MRFQIPWTFSFLPFSLLPSLSPSFLSSLPEVLFFLFLANRLVAVALGCRLVEPTPRSLILVALTTDSWSQKLFVQLVSGLELGAAHSNLVSFCWSMLPPPGYTRQGCSRNAGRAYCIWSVSFPLTDNTFWTQKLRFLLCVSGITQYSNQKGKSI